MEIYDDYATRDRGNRHADDHRDGGSVAVGIFKGQSQVTWLILAVGAAILAIVIFAHWFDRPRRYRQNLRHITGAREWWGKR